MTIIDFAQVEDAASPERIPPGEYPWVVDSASVRATKSGAQRVHVRLQIVGGMHHGRFTLDNLQLSGAGLKRTKQVLASWGIEASGPVDLSRALIEGLHCTVRVVIDDSSDGWGERPLSNKVPYDGYVSSDQHVACVMSVPRSEVR